MVDTRKATIVKSKSRYWERIPEGFRLSVFEKMESIHLEMQFTNGHATNATGQFEIADNRSPE